MKAKEIIKYQLILKVSGYLPTLTRATFLKEENAIKALKERISHDNYVDGCVIGLNSAGNLVYVKEYTNLIKEGA